MTLFSKTHQKQSIVLQTNGRRSKIFCRLQFSVKFCVSFYFLKFKIIIIPIKKLISCIFYYYHIIIIIILIVHHGIHGTENINPTILGTHRAAILKIGQMSSIQQFDLEYCILRNSSFFLAGLLKLKKVDIRGVKQESNTSTVIVNPINFRKIKI